MPRESFWFRRKLTERRPCLTNGDDGGPVHPQNRDRGSARWGTTDDPPVWCESEVIIPVVTARVKQRNNGFRLQISQLRTSAFLQGKRDARQCQVVGRRETAF